MDGVGEVNDSRPLRQHHDAPLRREHVNLVGEQIDLDVLEELLRIAGVALHLQQVLQPIIGQRLRRAALAGGLVEPVGGDTGLGDPLHVVGADLHLDRGAVGTEQDRVQGLVAIGLGNGDVVLELARYRFVQVVHLSEHAIAGIDTVDGDAEGKHVDEIMKGARLFLHLAVDAVQMFLATGHLTRDVFLRQPAANRRLDVGHQFALVLTRAAHRAL